MSVTYRRIGLFFVLAYAFTWFGNLGNYFWPSEYWFMPMNPFGPLMAAPLAIWITQGGAGVRAWFSRLGKFRAPLWVYAAAFFGPLAIILSSVGLAAAAGAPTQNLPQLEWLEFVILVPVSLMMGPGPEETAFRGYAQHDLQEVMSPLAASLWIGIGVVIWHLPLILTGDITLPWIICIVAVSVVYAWIYNMGGSIWPVVLVHFTVNYFGGEYFGQIIAAPQGQLLYASIHAGFYLAWAAAIVLLFGSSLTGRRQSGSGLIRAGRP